MGLFYVNSKKKSYAFSWFNSLASIAIVFSIFMVYGRKITRQILHYHMQIDVFHMIPWKPSFDFSTTFSFHFVFSSFFVWLQPSHINAILMNSSKDHFQCWREVALSIISNISGIDSIGLDIACHTKLMRFIIIGSIPCVLNIILLVHHPDICIQYNIYIQIYTH